ncbi:UNVERIFIED_ORG: hypothetical protein GCAPEGMB_00454 [Vibrio phage V07]
MFGRVFFGLIGLLYAVMVAAILAKLGEPSAVWVFETLGIGI